MGCRTDKNKKEIQGYLTVYAALSMTILLSLCLVLIDGARRSTVRMEAEIIAEIGMESILAEFHREMLEQYNLFYVDTSYGSSVPSWQKTKEHLQQYLEKNCDMEEVLLGDWWYRDMLALEPKEVQITSVRTAVDRQGAVLRSQAIEAVKDDVGLVYLEEVRSWMDIVEEQELDSRDIEEERQQIAEEIQSYDGTRRQLSEDEWVTIEVENPAGGLGSIRSDGILSMVVEDTSSLSQREVDGSILLSKRIQDGQVNQGNDEEEVASDGWMERLLFQEYLMRYCGYYGGELDKGALQYQAEYLITGKTHDIDNLKGAVHRISAMREVANALYLYGDEAKCAEAETVAAAAASAILLPELTPLFKHAILLGWAYMESLYDVKVLMAGGKVPLLKDAASWHYDIGCIFGEGADGAVQASEKGLAYADYLRVLLALSDLETVTGRFMDIVELDIRQTPGNGQFRLDGCIDRIEAVIIIKSGYGFEYEITRKRGYL